MIDAQQAIIKEKPRSHYFVLVQRTSLLYIRRLVTAGSKTIYIMLYQAPISFLIACAWWSSYRRSEILQTTSTCIMSHRNPTSFRALFGDLHRCRASAASRIAFAAFTFYFFQLFNNHHDESSASAKGTGASAQEPTSSALQADYAVSTQYVGKEGCEKKRSIAGEALIEVYLVLSATIMLAVRREEDKVYTFLSSSVFLTLVYIYLQLYSLRSEVPRVVQIYDIVHMGQHDIKESIRKHFYEHKDIKDERVITMLLERGYIDLEDTLLQHKQKNHLMLLLENPIGTDFNNKRLGPDSTEEEQFQRWVH